MLDPLGAAHRPGPDAYFLMMESNARALVSVRTRAEPVRARRWSTARALSYHRDMQTFARWAALAALCLTPALVWAAKYFSPCCYSGEVTRARLTDLALVLDDGSSPALPESFAGLGADGERGQPLFTQRWRYLGQVGALAEKAERYDANDDGMMDHQELLVLVIVEGGLAIGLPASGLSAGGQPVRALAIPGDEIRVLTGWLKRNEDRMSDAGLSLFMDVDALRHRMRGRSGSRR